MDKGRVTSFSDGVLAIILTIMVLELARPAEATWAAMRTIAPSLLVYALSFINVGIYWNNHHHFYHLVDRVNGALLWANLDLLFWLSLIPFATGWLGQFPSASAPTEAYGAVALLSGAAWTVMVRAAVSAQGNHSRLAKAMGSDRKGRLSVLLYALGIVAAHWRPVMGDALYVAVALLWLVPDRRVAHALYST